VGRSQRVALLTLGKFTSKLGAQRSSLSTDAHPGFILRTPTIEYLMMNLCIFVASRQMRVGTV